jgi:hypothetical protein
VICDGCGQEIGGDARVDVTFGFSAGGTSEYPFTGDQVPNLSFHADCLGKHSGKVKSAAATFGATLKDCARPRVEGGPEEEE